MIFLNGAALLLLNVLLVSALHEPGRGIPSFVRSAVESVSKEESEDNGEFNFKNLAKFSIKPEFGDLFLPLRSAVETVPSIGPKDEISNLGKSFIRAAVEYMPPHNSEAYSAIEYVAEESHPNAVYVENISPIRRISSSSSSTNQNMGEKYAAFVIPTQYEKNDPQPYRYGSPYQQIVDVNSFRQQVEESTLQRLRIRDKDFNSKPKVLCYFTSWAHYRDGDGKFAPENVDTQLCTALIYSYASLDPDSLLIKQFDPWVDNDNDLYRRTTSLDIPVLIAMGGWTDSTENKYSRLAASASARKQFASNLVLFLKTHGFKGIHLDWNYPKCWQSDCRKGPSSDKPNFSKLIADIRSEFDRSDPDLQLGIAISGYKEVISEAYDLKELSKNVDYLTVMTYDYHGAWELKTGHVSPLYERPSDKYPQYNVDFTMQLLVKSGAAPEKLIMGIPFYGQSYTLRSERSTLVGEGAAAEGPGEPGEFTKQPGMLAYYEICQRIRKNKWLTGRDPSHKSGPYAMLKNQWVGYEDASSVEAKARYASNNGFGGVAAWTIDLDDFRNRCCGESFPLLKAINRALGRLSSPPPSGTNCQKPQEPVTPAAPIMTTVSENGSPPIHEHTTWPSWHPTSRKPETSTWWPISTSTTRMPQTVTTTTKPPSKRTTMTTTKVTKPPTEHTTIPVPSVIMPDNPLEGRKCDVGEVRRNENNCNSYYQCVFGEMRLQYCAGGLHFNENIRLCDWPDSAKCELNKRGETPKPVAPIKRTTTKPMPSTSIIRSTTTRKITTTSTTTKIPNTTKPAKRTTTKKPFPTTARPTFGALTSCENGMFYPHKECDSFYVCVNNRRITQQCGPGLQWNIKESSCDLEENVKCVSITLYNKLLRISHPLLKSSPLKALADDPCDGNTFVPYPGDCNQYLICNWNRLEAASCSPGLHWNQNAQVCDWPKNAHCSEGSGGSLPEVDNDGHENDISSMVTTRRPGYAPSLGTTTTTSRPTFPNEKPVLDPLSGYYKVVCYFTNWAWYRKGIGRYTPDDINTDLCTHIVYGFAVLDYSELTIRTHDSWADIDNKFYERVAALKERGVKVSLALGGWNDSQGDKYSRLVRNPASRARFVRQATEFIEKYGFEGLDLDWEYPVCWQTECNKGFPDEKEGFTSLVRELSAVFRPKRLLLSTAVSPSKKIIDLGYDVPELAKYFDWIAVMTYDYHGQWDKKTGHVAPLFYHPDDDYDYFNANFSINYWIEKGAPSRTIVMGMPLYGQSFTISDVTNHGLNSHAPGPGQAGEHTRAAGFLAYYEICDRVNFRNWNVVRDEKGRMGPYAYKDNQWVSYDDQEILKRKSQLVRDWNLGGGMVWALDLDDFNNHCGEGVHPLLTTIREILRDPPGGPGSTIDVDYNNNKEEEEPGSEGDYEECYDEQHESIPDNIETNIVLVEPTSTGDSEIIEAPHDSMDYIDPNMEVEENGIGSPGSASSQLTNDFKVVCYFTNWAWYRQGGGKYLPEDIDADLCTHIVYGFAVLDRDSLTIKPHDSWADLDNKFYERIVAYKAKGIKVTVAIGGWNDSAGDKYSRLVRNPSARARFIRHVVEFIEKYGFEGLDLDWEYPVCWQVDCKKGSPDEKESFSDLVRELSEAFVPKGLLLSSAVSPNKKVIDAGYDVPQLSYYFDWIAVMTYDFHGQWDKKTGHIAPMYATPDDDPTFNANFTINYWIEQGADRKKLVMGMPMYGQSFSLAEASNHGLNAPTYGGGEAGEATRARGFLSYYEICKNIRNKKWTVVRDKRGRIGPYAYKGDQWVSFDDSPMIRHKSEFVKAMDLGGAMIWALDLDDFKDYCECESYPLLKTINRVLRNYPGPDPRCRLEERAEIESDIMRTTTPKPQKTSTVWWSPSSTTGAPTRRTTRLTTVFTNRPQTGIDKENEVDLEEETVNLDCAGRNFAPHHRDCNKFYTCQFGVLIEQRCPDGLHWNENHCDWPQKANCIVSDRMTTTQKTTMRPTTPKTEATTTRKITTTTSSWKPEQRPGTTSRPQSPDSKPPVVQGDEKYKVVCYFTNWAWYRPGEGKYRPSDIDENLCTHIVYGFAVLNSQTLTIKTHDSWADIDNKFYEKVAEYKNRGIRVTLAIGGWNDSLGDKYSRLVRDPEARARFIKHVVDFLEKYGFEGLDLDWEYPVCWQVDCDKGKPDEKQAFAAFVRELSAAFKPRGLLLSAAVSPSKKVIDAGYDVPVLAKYFDWIAVMTYDFHGHWDKETGHVAPLYYMPGDKYDYFNGNFSIHYWIEKGAPPQKLVMGMPLYGQSFTLAQGVTEKGLNQKITGPGQAGRYTRAAGFLAYYEICEKVNSGGWTVVRDNEGRMGPYAYSGNQWVSYDDVEDIRRKSQFLKRMNLGGGMIWALDLDDFRGRCGCGKHPLLRTLNQELRGISGQRSTNCT
ncbi:probable chitinase 10 [Condylostylus longicornis]|uniref:probable chitinase 10 n=1 Tax=Condylostylus longicornis TaxID=2530218 RepID=UPI00244E2AFD|nr:probable chitinase 10 [Condylostylus longicornis]